MAWLTISMHLAALAALTRLGKHLILERHRGEQTLQGAKRVAVFAHYDSRGRVDDYVVNYLMELRAAGLTTIFMTNSPRLEPGALQRILPLCALAVRRKNVGYDFGAYKDGIGELEDVSALDELLLANDSVYGPFRSLDEILAACDDRAAVWGITDSWSRRYHLQSYFLLFKKTALTAPALMAFWTSVRYVQSKDLVIRRYEIGLTQALLRAGLHCEALCPYRLATAALNRAVLEYGLLQREDIPQSYLDYARHIFGSIEHGIPLNPMHHFWDYLITEMGCPFIKRELLIQNPQGIPYVPHWERVIRRVSEYDTSMILRHVQRGARDRIF